MRLELADSLADLVDVLDDLLERGGLDPEAHHGQDRPDRVHVDRAVLAEAVEAFLQHWKIHNGNYISQSSF